VEPAQQVSGDRDGERVIVARQGRGGPNAVQEERGLLEVCIDEVDRRACAVPDAQRGCLGARLISGDGQFDDNLVPGTGRAGEDRGAKPAFQSTNDVEAPGAEAGAEPNGKSHVRVAP
jgi:hypothetical protein